MHRAASIRRLTRLSLCLVVVAITFSGCLEREESNSGPAQPAASHQSGPRPTPQVRARMRALLKAWVREADAPGAQLSLTDGSRMISVAAGVADRGSGRKMTPDDRLRVASVSKTLVAAVVLQLVEEGKLSLSDTIDEWFPKIPRARSITIRMLLDHTSGVPDYTESDAYSELPDGPDHPWAHVRTARVVATMKRPFAPGDRYSYSNSNYHLLGLIVEDVTGTSLAAQIRRRAFRPTELEDSVMDDGFGRHPATARGYDADGNDLSRSAYGSGSAWRTAGWADGGAVMTARDLAWWGHDLLTPDEILSARMLRTMTEPAVTREDGNGLGIFGDDPMKKGRYQAVGHDGGDLGYESLMVHYTDLDVTVSFITNTETGDDAPDALPLARKAAIYAAGVPTVG